MDDSFGANFSDGRILIGRCPQARALKCKRFFPSVMLMILDLPRIFNAFTRIVGGDMLAVFVDRYIRPVEGDKILDIGCGPADILYHLPGVEYVGLDMNSAYINHARKRFGNKGRFLAQRVSQGVINSISPSCFDTVLAKGVLNHLRIYTSVFITILSESHTPTSSWNASHENTI